MFMLNNLKTLLNSHLFDRNSQLSVKTSAFSVQIFTLQCLYLKKLGGGGLLLGILQYLRYLPTKV